MNNSGWVKVHRKAKENKIMQDQAAWQLFSWVLLSVDNTGTYYTSRLLLAEQLSCNSNTIYKTLQRLIKKYKVVTASSNNKCTTIKLLNWDKYQTSDKLATEVSNNEVTTGQQRSNNADIYKNIRIKNKEYINILPDKSGTVKAKPEKLNTTHPYKEIITYCRTRQGIEQEWPIYQKQLKAVKKILDSGYSLDNVRFVIDEMASDAWWQGSPFDLMNVANNMHKYMNRVVMFKKGGSARASLS